VGRRGEYDRFSSFETFVKMVTKFWQLARQAYLWAIRAILGRRAQVSIAHRPPKRRYPLRVREDFKKLLAELGKKPSTKPEKQP
jgi:hypothetical protein